MKKTLIATVFVLALAITNPGKDNYGDFISKHIKRSLCDKTEMPRPLKSVCGMITRPVAKAIIYESTDRTNLVLLSYYHTDLLGVAEIKTVGVGGIFIPLPLDY